VKNILDQKETIWWNCYDWICKIFSRI